MGQSPGHPPLVPHIYTQNAPTYLMLGSLQCWGGLILTLWGIPDSRGIILTQWDTPDPMNIIQSYRASPNPEVIILTPGMLSNPIGHLLTLGTSSNPAEHPPAPRHLHVPECCVQWGHGDRRDGGSRTALGQA